MRAMTEKPSEALPSPEGSIATESEWATKFLTQEKTEGISSRHSFQTKQ